MLYILSQRLQPSQVIVMQPMELHATEDITLAKDQWNLKTGYAIDIKAGAIVDMHIPVAEVFRSLRQNIKSSFKKNSVQCVET